MIYDEMYMGGVLVHGERSHKYLQKIKTKTGKWRYIYKNTLNYRKNKKLLPVLEESRDFYRKQANIYQNEANEGGKDVRRYASMANRYKQNALINESHPHRYNDPYYFETAKMFRDDANRAMKSAISAYKTSKREKEVAKETKAISDANSRRAREVKSQINNSLQEITKRKVNKILNKLRNKKI